MSETAVIHRLFTSERVDAWRARYFWPNAVVAILGLASFLLFHGKLFPAAWEPLVAIFQSLCLLVLIGETVGVYAVARRLRDGWEHAGPDTIALLVGVFLGLALFFFSHWVTGVLDDEGTFTAFAYLTQAGLLGFGGSRLLRLFSFITRLASAPLLVFVGSFLVLILIGAGLLLLPGAHKPGVNPTPMNALFMSTSATCVTGLTVLDIGRDFTRFGQLVILTLIQIGGLGIMTFAAFFSLLFGRGTGVRDASAFGEMINVDFVGRVGRMIAWILGLTFSIELAGTLALYGNWVDEAGTALPAGEQLYYSAFHSISAFCNAGFSLHGDSLVRYAGSWPMVLSISSLVVLGGLGFTVMTDLLTYRFWAHPLARRVPFLRRRVRNQAIPRLTVQTKMVLVATLLLLVAGTAGFYALEYNNTLSDLGWGDQLARAFFGGMTPRTAGFNTVDVANMKPASKYFTILLMMVGASPGSTGGGLKTTTFALMFLALVATFRGRSPEAFRRRIPEGLIRKSLVMLVLVLVLVNMATMAMMITEADGAAAARHGFENVTFEVVSAFCTVGLSTGLTPELTFGGKLIIIATMFVGRVGPLTLVLAIGSRRAQKFEYPDEAVMIG